MKDEEPLGKRLKSVKTMVILKIFFELQHLKDFFFKISCTNGKKNPFFLPQSLDFPKFKTLCHMPFLFLQVDRPPKVEPIATSFSSKSRSFN